MPKREQRDWLTKKSSRLSKMDICVLLCNGLDAPTLHRLRIIVTSSLLLSLRAPLFGQSPENVCAIRASIHSQTRERGTRDILEAIFLDPKANVKQKHISLVRIGTNALPDMRYMREGSRKKIRKEAMSIRKFRLTEREFEILREACDAFRALPQIYARKGEVK